jgi:putative membrane protein
MSFRGLFLFFRLPTKKIKLDLSIFLIFILIYSISIDYLNNKYHFIKNIGNLWQFNILFSFCISVVIGFRLNVSYTRWWEARGSIGGIGNNLRSLTIKFHNIINLDKDEKMKDYLSHLPIFVANHLLKESSKNIHILNQLNLTIPKEQNTVLFLIAKIHESILNHRKKHNLSFEEYLSLDAHINNIIDCFGACEKVLYTTLPIAHSIFTRFAIVFYAIIFPIGWAEQFHFMITPIVIIMSYILLGLELLAEEMEEPFGYDENDLKVNIIANTLNNNIKDICTISDQNNKI